MAGEGRSVGARFARLYVEEVWDGAHLLLMLYKTERVEAFVAGCAFETDLLHPDQTRSACVGRRCSLPCDTTESVSEGEGGGKRSRDGLYLAPGTHNLAEPQQVRE